MSSQAYEFAAGRPFATGTPGWDDPSAVVGFVTEGGTGRAVVLGATLGFDHLYKHALTREIAQLLDWPADFAFDPGVELEASLRAGGHDSARYTFLTNYLDYPQTTVVRAGGAEQLGGHPVTLAARESLILVENAHIAGIPVAWATGEFQLWPDARLTIKGSSPRLHIATAADLDFDTAYEQTVTPSGYEYTLTNPGRSVEVTVVPVPGQN
ncbi:MAG: hypothetical protein ACOYEV_03640 [Candidatus Nanopelagicales bacterium]